MDELDGQKTKPYGVTRRALDLLRQEEDLGKSRRKRSAALRFVLAALMAGAAWSEWGYPVGLMVWGFATLIHEAGRNSDG